MEETLASQRMAEIDLINNLEKISSKIPDRILKLEGYILKENHKEQLEIVIFKGFSSSTTHPIEIDLEKRVVGFSYILTNFKLYKAPLTENEDNFIKENWISAHFSKRDNLKNDKYHGERYAHDNRFFNIIFTKLNDKAYIHPFFESSVINDAITDKHLCITEKSGIPFLCGAIAIPLSSMFYVTKNI